MNTRDFFFMGQKIKYIKKMPWRLRKNLSVDVKSTTSRQRAIQQFAQEKKIGISFRETMKMVQPMNQIPFGGTIISIQELARTQPSYHRLLNYHLTLDSAKHIKDLIKQQRFEWHSIGNLNVTNASVSFHLDQAIDNEHHEDIFYAIFVFRFLWAYFYQQRPHQLREYIRDALQNLIDDIYEDNNSRKSKTAKLAYAYHVTRAFLERDPMIVNRGTNLVQRVWDVKVDDEDETIENDIQVIRAMMLNIFDTKLFRKAVASHFQALGVFLSVEQLSNLIVLCKGFTITPLKLLGTNFLTGFVLPDGIGLFLRFLENKEKHALENKKTLARCLIVGLHETGHYLIRNQHIVKSSFSDETPSNKTGDETTDFCNLEGGKLFEFLLFGTYCHKIEENEILRNRLWDLMKWKKPPLFTREEINQLEPFEGNFRNSAIHPEQFFLDEIE